MQKESHEYSKTTKKSRSNCEPSHNILNAKTFIWYFSENNQLDMETSVPHSLKRGIVHFSYLNMDVK